AARYSPGPVGALRGAVFPEHMLPSYVPILILGGVAAGFAVFTLVVSQLLGKPRPNKEKNAVYECGMPTVAGARERFPIKFYLVCMIVLLLGTGFVYAWKQGALDW